MVKGVRRVLLVLLLLPLASSQSLSELVGFVPEGYRMTTIRVSNVDLNAGYLRRGNNVDIILAAENESGKITNLVRNVTLVDVHPSSFFSSEAQAAQYSLARLLLKPEQTEILVESDYFVVGKAKLVPVPPIFIRPQVIEPYACRCLFEDAGLSHNDWDFCPFEFRGLKCL